MAEGLKATDCKFVSFTFIGSNPIFFVYFFLVIIKDRLALFFIFKFSKYFFVTKVFSVGFF